MAQEKNKETISLNKDIYKKEFLKYGLQLGLFDMGNMFSIEARLNEVDIVINEDLDEYGKIIYDKGTPTIQINVSRCLSDNKSLDEVIFHKLAHICNEIQRDIHVYGEHRIDRFKSDYLTYALGNDYIADPDLGMKMLDEVISEYTSRAMVYAKVVEADRCILEPSSYADPKFVFFKPNEVYEKMFNLVDNFSKTIFKHNDALYHLCCAAYNETLVDNIMCKYRDRNFGMKELYEILGGMGYVFKGLINKEKGIDPVGDEKAASRYVYAFNKINRVLESEGKEI